MVPRHAELERGIRCTVAGDQTAVTAATPCGARGPAYRHRQFAAFARGIGNEFAPACDMSLPLGTKALFGNPEGGVGLIRGGGALAWLPRLVGRSRALGIVLSADHIDADIAE